MPALHGNNRCTPAAERPERAVGVETGGSRVSNDMPLIATTQQVPAIGHAKDAARSGLYLLLIRAASKHVTGVKTARLWWVIRAASQAERTTRTGVSLYSGVRVCVENVLAAIRPLASG